MLYLFLIGGLLGQASLNVITNKNTTYPMSSYLNGAGRNHTQGYFDDVMWSENRFDDKVALYKGIDNKFTEQGRMVYRLGHNISDGLNGTYCPATKAPGWHWATEYGTGYDEQYFANLIRGHEDCNGVGIFEGRDKVTTRLGSGIRAFLYKTDEEFSFYSGFAVTLNYDNSIYLKRRYLPESYSILLLDRDLFQIPEYIDQIKIATGNDPLVTIHQIGGPSENSKVGFGIYTMEYRITKGDDVSYWGFVIGVNSCLHSSELIRTNADELYEINPDPSLFPVGTSALVRHSKIVTTNTFKVVDSPLYECGYKESDVHIDVEDFLRRMDIHKATENPYKLYLTEYDDLKYTLKDAAKLNADLAVVVNIATGYPEETAGLIEYLTEIGVPIAYIELGSELMGSWNKGAYLLGPNETIMGQTTLPFAKKVKNHPDRAVSNTKIATTSTYNFTLEFDAGGTPNPSNTGNFKEITKNWLTALSDPLTNRCYVDYLNIHTYPSALIANTVFNDIKFTGLMADMVAFETKVLPEVRFGIKELRFKNPVDIVVTEFNTAWEKHDVCIKTNDEGMCIEYAPISAEKDAQPNTITEGFYFAENFMVAAENQIKALSPFALVKATSLYIYQDGQVVKQNFKVYNSDPSHPESYFEQSNEPQQSIHFYPNSMAVENATFPANSTPYTDIFVKPVFKVKKMIFENLGTQVIPKSLTVITDNPNVNASPIQYSYASNDVVDVPQFNTLTTISKDKDYLYILITNRNAKKGEDTTPFKVSVDNVLIPSAEIMYLDGKAYNDKQPDYTNAVAGTSANLFNRTQPTYKPVNSVNGIFDIPNLSICILKVALTPLPTLDCAKVSPTSTPSSCDAISVSWNPAQNQILSNPLLTNVNIVSQSVYYYELLDAPNNPVITTFDPNDPNWRLYADNLPPACDKILLTGLKYPQDEYPIAVVTRYQYNTAGPTVIGLNSRLSACLVNGRTSHCENRIDVSKINTATLGTATNPNAYFLNQLITYSDVAFCGDQVTAPSAINFYGITDFEFDVSNIRLDAIKLYGGADNGVFEIYYDTDLNVAGYSNINPLWATTSAFGTTIIPIVCGVDNVKRIKIRKMTAGDNLRRFVLYGVPMTPTTNEPMPKCCGSNTKKTITQSTVSAAIAAGKLLPMNPSLIPAPVGTYANNTPQEVFINTTDPQSIFTVDQDYVFFGSKVYIAENKKIQISPSITTLPRLFTITDGTILEGCEFMWEGIKVGNRQHLVVKGSTIKDAKIAVDAEVTQSHLTNATKPRLSIGFNTKFERNKEAIYIHGFSNSLGLSTLHSGSFFNTFTIEGTNHNLKSIKNGTSILPQGRASLGINVMSIFNIYLGQLVTGDASIKIKNVTLPILFQNTGYSFLFSVGVDNRNFKLNNQWLSFASIRTRGSLSFNYKNDVNNITQRIQGSKIGIISDKDKTINLNNIYMDEMNTSGIFNVTENANVFYSKLLFKSSGLLIGQPKSYKVQNTLLAHSNLPNGSVVLNNSLPVNTYGGIGIGINYPAFDPLFTSSGLIADNQIYVKNNIDFPDFVTTGIVLNNATNSTIRHNTIGLQNLAPTFNELSNFYAIYKQSGLDNTICSNDLYGQLGYDRGIGGFMSPGEITCNKIWNTKQSLYFVGDNTADDGISGNELKDSYTAIQVDNVTSMDAQLGVQFRQGNKWINNYGYGGVWSGDYTFIGNSRFDNADQATYFPIEPVVAIIPNTPQSPPNPPIPLDWMAATAGTINLFTDCINSVGVSSFYCKPESEGGRLEKQQSELKEPYRSMILRKAWAENHQRYADGNAPAAIEDFLQEYKGTGFAQLALIDEMVQNPLAIASALAQELLVYRDSVKNLEAGYLAVKSQSDLVSFENQVQVLEPAVVNPALLSYQKGIEYLANLEQVADSIVKQQYDAARLANLAFFPDDAATQLEQAVNAVYLDLLVYNKTDVSYDDSIFIRNTAYLCPQAAGDGVFKARALWLQLGEAIDKTWDACYAVEAGTSNRELSSGLLKIEPKVLSDKLPLIYPVPLSDVLTIAVPVEYIGGQYEVINTGGITIATGTLPQVTTDVNASTWSNGLHFVRILTKDFQPVTIKIVVQKL
jgi:hypothetical protein